MYQIGDLVWQVDGTTGVVESVEAMPVQQRMYNLTVDIAHTFFVGQQGWLVHNACSYSSITGYADRLESVSAYVTPNDLGTGQATNLASRLWARAMGKSTDDAGHAVSKKLGGLLTDNIFPQSVNINRGAYRQFELQLAELITQTGNPASINIQFIYDTASSTRPTSIIYEATINGNIFSQVFSNP
ncbi:MAG: DNA/RNA non-specific endonuclease [Caldilineaceae bacterium]